MIGPIVMNRRGPYLPDEAADARAEQDHDDRDRKRCEPGERRRQTGTLLQVDAEREAVERRARRR